MKRILTAWSFIATSVAVLWLTLLPSIAHAFADDKTFPATSCRRMDQTGAQGTLGVRDDGSIENDSATTGLTVICPIVRDNTITTDAWSMVVSVLDKSGASVTCTATSRTEFGTWVDDGTASTSAGGQGLAPLPLAITPQDNEGYSVLKCTIPPAVGANRSKIIAYRISEPGDGEAGDTDRKAYTGAYAELATAAVGGPPHIKYPSSGEAKPVHALAADDWILPIVRDSTLEPVDIARVRMLDGDADQFVECWLGDYNENGSLNPNLGYGAQDVGSGNATIVVDDLDQGFGGAGGPLALYCDSAAADTTVWMYDVAEEDDGS